MRTSFRNLLRLNEAVEEEDADKKEKTALELQQDAAKLNFDDETRKAAEQTGGYANPLAVPFTADDQDRWANKAKLMGTNINIIRSQEMNDNLQKQKEEKQQKANEVARAEHLTKATDFANNYNTVLKSLGLPQELQLPSGYLDPKTGAIKTPANYDFAIADTVNKITDNKMDLDKLAQPESKQDLKRLVLGVHDERLGGAQKNLDELKQSISSMKKRFGSVDFSGKGGGKLELPSGEVIDINDIEKTLSGQKVPTKDLDAAIFGNSEKKDDEGNLISTPFQSLTTDKNFNNAIADVRRQQREFKDHVAKLEKEAKDQERHENAMGFQQRKAEKEAAKQTGVPVAAAAAASSGSWGGGSNAPASVSTEGRSDRSTPEATSSNDRNVDAAAAGGGLLSSRTPETAPFSFNALKQEPKTNPTQVLALVPGADFLSTQQQLTRSVANPASASQAEEDTTRVMVGSGKEKKSGSKDVRYGARKATSKGVAVVAESIRFNKGDLSGILNEKLSIGALRKISKGLAGTKAGAKGLGKGLLNTAGAFMKYTNPVDRFPMNLYQAGWSKAKDLRQARYLYQNPAALAGLATTIAGVGGKAGAALLGSLFAGTNTAPLKELGGLAGKFGAALGLDDPKVQAGAIPQIMSIIGDPRAANIDPGAITVKSDEDEQQDVISALLGKSKKTP